MLVMTGYRYCVDGYIHHSIEHVSMSQGDRKGPKAGNVKLIGCTN